MEIHFLNNDLDAFVLKGDNHDDNGIMNEYSIKNVINFQFTKVAFSKKFKKRLKHVSLIFLNSNELFENYAQIFILCKTVVCYVFSFFYLK